MLGNGLHLLGNGPHVLGKYTLGIMLYLGLCRNWDYVVRDYVAFGIMSFRIMFLGIVSHSG